MAHRIRFAKGLFAPIHDERIGPYVELPPLDLAKHDPALVNEAKLVWQDRVHTEFRSIQIMTRFLTEVVGAGDPIDVYATAIDFVEDEVRHTELCMAMCRAFGFDATFPDPVALREPEQYVKAPMPQRALTTAIAMLAINETLSVAFIEDLRDRATEPAVQSVLEQTVADEAAHEGLGWEYVKHGLGRFPRDRLEDWRHLVRTTLAPHRDAIARALSNVPASERSLEKHLEPERAALGLHGDVRLALVADRTIREKLVPRLAALELL